MAQRCALVDALNIEWAQLAATGSGPVRRWAGRHPALAGCRDLAELLIALRERPDQTLGVLLVECQAGDQLAGRVVVQAMLGKIILMGSLDHEQTIDDYVASLWLVISRYPLERRPRRIAANLALDTRKLARADGRRFRSSVVWPCPPELLADRPVATHDDQEPAAVQLIDAARRLGVINDETHKVMTTVYADGYRGVEAAERHRITPEMVRYRCSDGTRRMQRHAGLLRDAA